jgi:hypothetical protein
VLVELGGTPRVWRTDRMATAVIPGTDRLNPQFAQLAKHYGSDVAICPAHRPQRKGVVEAAIRFIGGRWWRTAKANSMAEAQRSLDAFAATTSDARRRCNSTVGELGASEPLRALPALAFPAQIIVERICSRSALVAFEGNRYSVPPALVGQTVTVSARLGELHLEVLSAAGRRVARHRRAPAGAGQLLRTDQHARLLEQAVLDAFTTNKPCRRKANRPPGPVALTAAARLQGQGAGGGVVVDLEDYARIASVAR